MASVNSTITPQQNMQTLAATRMIKDPNQPKKPGLIVRLFRWIRNRRK